MAVLGLNRDLVLRAGCCFIAGVSIFVWCLISRVIVEQFFDSGGDNCGGDGLDGRTDNDLEHAELLGWLGGTWGLDQSTFGERQRRCRAGNDEVIKDADIDEGEGAFKHPG
jgi:hypothetical protein